MGAPVSDSAKLINLFKAELIRWNRQINLVSRVDTRDRLDGLFSQCIGGAEAILTELNHSGVGGASELAVYYFDLGSGGGLPGAIWHILFSEAFSSTQSWLVEPREKRAWFLDRLNRIPDMPAFGVLHARWGEGSLVDSGSFFPTGENSVVVISLKALHLCDLEVLTGFVAVLASLSGHLRVIIVRYYPPGQVYDHDLIEALGIVDTGQCHEVEGYLFCGKGGRVISLPFPGEKLASLVLSSYELTAKN